MAEIKYKENKISDIFSYKRGNSEYTRKYCNQNKGDYEVFTGTTIGSFAFIDSYDYEGELLTYTTDGKYAGTLQLLKGKFNVGGHRTILLPRSDNLYLEFFVYTLQDLLYSRVKKGDVPSLTWKEIESCKVNVPVDENGNFCLDTQKEIVKKYENIERKKNNLRKKLDYINNVEINFLESRLDIVKELSFEELFLIERGKVISKRYINDNKGDYPVYSTQLDEAFGHIDTYMYDGKYLIWNTDGLGGYIRLMDDKFSITNIVGIMKTKKKYKDIVDLEYIRRNLQPIFRENIKGREGLNGKSEYTKLNSTMIKDLDIKIKFPVDKNGDIDLDKQREIVKKYYYIDEMKENINKEIKRLLATKIDLQKNK